MAKRGLCLRAQLSPCVVDTIDDVLCTTSIVNQVHILVGGEWNDPEESFIKSSGEKRRILRLAPLT